MFGANILVIIALLCHEVASLQQASTAVKRSLIEESVISLLKEEEKNNRDFQSTVLKTINHFQTKFEEMRKNSNEENLKNRDFQSTILKIVTSFQTELEEMRNKSGEERFKNRDFQSSVLKNMNRFHTELTDLSTNFSFYASELLQDVTHQREISSSSFERVLSKLYCPSQFRYIQNSCFKLSNVSVDWKTAKKKCLEDNSHLVFMESHRLRSLLVQESLKNNDTVWTIGKEAYKGVGDIDSNLLTTDRVALLREWLPGKEFKLLYRASRDGMNPSVFHSRCDNKGPTITIGKDLKSGTTFGGYASVSWTGTNSYKTDSNSFVFRLCHRQGCTSAKYSGSPHWALFDAEDLGPTFGGGHDLSFFSGSISYDNTNMHFLPSGQCMRSTFNGNLDCGLSVEWTDVEVWSVVDPCVVFNPSNESIERKSCNDEARYICEL